MRLPVGLYVPQAADAPRVSGVYARAMSDDPLNRCFFPAADQRERALEALYTAIARVGIGSRMLLATSPAIEGAAFWDLPGEKGFSVRAMVHAGVLHFLHRAGFHRAFLMMRYEGWAHEMFARHAPPGSAHLLLLSVDPPHQGKGFAGALLRPVLAALDADGTACCLETQNPRNVPLYEHFGFRAKLHTRVPGTDVDHWVMVRPGGRSAAEEADRR
jgi:GNAT superfamily N-acetyltransferase